MAVTQRGRGTQAMFDLLRQLALGLSTYRLFPDDPDQPGAVAADARILEASRKALALDQRHAEVRSGRFRAADGTELSDEHVDRLAQACYARGVEFLHLRDVPSTAELRSIYRALSLAEPEVAAQGGVGTILQRAGVVAVRLGDVAPEGAEDVDRAMEGLNAEQLDVWQQVLDPARFAANLLVEGLPDDEATAAHDVYRRFETIRAVLPVSRSADPLFVQNLIRIVERLPDHVQREFGAHAITRMRVGDELASNYLGSMTDPELANVLIDLQESDGPDARDVADELVGTVGRQTGIVEVTTAFLEARGLLETAGGDDAGALVTALSDVRGGPAADSLSRDTAADVFASRLVTATDTDIIDLRTCYPDTDGALREVSLDAFRDYLLNETDTGRLGQALEVWAGHLRDAVTAGDDPVVEVLFDVIERAYAELPSDEKRRLVGLARSQILDAELLRSLAERAKHDVETPVVVATLRRFGYFAEEALLDLLAVEENRGTRAVLVSMLAELAQDDPDAVVDRLGDPRWYVVRNCVTILGRVPDRGGFHHLTPLVGHAHPEVRREAVRALVSSAGADAVPYLERLAHDDTASVSATAITALGSLVSPAAAQALGRVVDAGSGLEERRRALDELRRHAAPDATEVLADLARRGHTPRLPRRVRKHAKACLSQRRSAR